VRETDPPGGPMALLPFGHVMRDIED